VFVLEEMTITSGPEGDVEDDDASDKLSFIFSWIDWGETVEPVMHTES